MASELTTQEEKSKAQLRSYSRYYCNSLEELVLISRINDKSIQVTKPF
jgi:hypothetical protein